MSKIITEIEKNKSEVIRVELSEFNGHDLIGIYGIKCLDNVHEYLEQWQQGYDTEPIRIKKDNAGRYQANAWLRKSFERNKL